MQHGADPNPCTYISRAGGQVTQLRVKGVIELLFEKGVRGVDSGPGLAKLKPRAERLHPEMVLLINHDAQGFVPVQNQSAAGALGGVLATDQMPLDENLLIE